MKLRSLAIGLSLLTAGTVVGVTTQQFASAEISTGDRPVLVPIEPCRLVDTRPGDATVGPRSAPLGAADTLTVDAQQTGTPCAGMIPTEALSLSLNVTTAGATEQSFLTIWAGGDRPDASSLNPAPGAPPTPNAVTVDLSADQQFQVYNNLGNVNLIIDVNGYYEHHNHDDRYYTEAEVEARIQTAKPEIIIPEPSINDFFEFDFVPEDYVSSQLDQSFSTTQPGRLSIDVYMNATATCSGNDDHIWMIEIDGNVLTSSAFLDRDDTEPGRLMLSGVTDQVIPAGDHTTRVGVECSTAASVATVSLDNLYRVSSVVVFPE